MGNRKGKRGKSAKFARRGENNAEPEEITKAPHSFVINRGKLGKNANELLLNFRKLMEPFTASQLKVQKQNVLKDFIHIAGPLNVSHLVVFTKSQNGMYLRISKLPHGPTLTFQIKEYSLVRDVISAQKKSVVYEKLFEHHPLLVLNNFSGDGMHFKLMTTTFQNMFPSINVNKTNLNTIRRTVLLHYNEDKTIDMRQYAIKIVPTGMSKAVKKLIQSKVPNLSQFNDIEDFLQKSGNLSESEVEMDTPANTVVLPQPISSRGNITAEKSAIRLFELGPRLKLQLVKIEEGIMSGEVLFHEFISKTPEEVAALKANLKKKKKLKESRKEQQRLNVERKKAALSKESEKPVEENKEKEDEDMEEDREWYRKEVGVEPVEDELPKIRKRKRNTGDFQRSSKKVRFSEDAKNDKAPIGKNRGNFIKGTRKPKSSDGKNKEKFGKEKRFKSSSDVFHSKNKRNPGASKYKSKKTRKG